MYAVPRLLKICNCCAMLRSTCAESVWAGVLESVTVTVYAKIPKSVGVPVILPVEIDRQAGGQRSIEGPMIGRVAVDGRKRIGVCEILAGAIEGRFCDRKMRVHHDCGIESCGLRQSVVLGGNGERVSADLGRRTRDCGGISDWPWVAAKVSPGGN